jgi:Fe2+ or Zn2+ uptake regulation protein
MTGSSDGVSTALAAEILGYMEQHPRAADRAEGIAQWWLPARRESVSLSEVRACLDELAVRGLIRRQILVDGSVIYKAVYRDGRD